ncbi:MAG: DHH family phosphoesterase [Euryarchaeota archaeon]|nr:DHH family phosphoesterase [Euryarchaeota archaeon]
MEGRPQEPLQPRAEAAADLLERLPPTSRVVVLADADTDGIAGASVIARALHRTGRRFTVRLSRRRDAAFFDELFARPPALLITCDLGAAEIERFQSARVPTIVLDHHEPQKDGTGTSLVHINPHLEGEDGSKGASGAAVAWVFARTWLERHGLPADDLVPAALVGAEGDRYHGGGEERGLHTRLKHHAGAERDDGPVGWQEPPILREGPLAEALAMGIDPYLVRFSGDPGAVRAALEEQGVPHDRPVAALSHPERRRLGTFLTFELLSQGADPSHIPRLLTPAPVLPDGTPVGRLAETVDAACRQGHATEALSALLGGPPEMERIHLYLGRYEEAIRAGLAGAPELSALPTTGPALVLRLDEGPYSGPVADRVNAWLDVGPRPVVCHGPTGARTKVSLRARTTPDGPHWRLDIAADGAARAVGGIGGGHKLAAGANVPSDQTEAFLERLGKALTEQAGGERFPSLREATA